MVDEKWKEVSVFKHKNRGWFQGFVKEENVIYPIFSKDSETYGISHLACINENFPYMKEFQEDDEMMKLDFWISKEHLYDNCRIEVDFLHLYGLDFDTAELLMNRNPAGNA